jgi:hypothetical protein
MGKNLTLGDYVTTCYSSPFAIQMQFEIEEMKNVASVPHAFGKYGAFPLTLLKKTRRPKVVKQIKSKREFIVNEEINHPKFGKGRVVEVFEYKVQISFKSGKTLDFISALLEKSLIN